jgi:DNA-binding NarL/FixJ family response regulator
LTGPDVNPSRIAAGSSERKLRVLVVDDHEVVHWGLRLMLGEQPWVERCLSARNTQEALALARRYDPHVALVDLFVGQESGAEICAQLLAQNPRVNVLLISGAGRISPNAAKAAGASGFISKDWPAADIAGAVRMVGLGMTVFKRCWRRSRPARRTARSPGRSTSAPTRSRSTRLRSTANSASETGPRRSKRPSVSASSRNEGVATPQRGGSAEGRV